MDSTSVTATSEASATGRAASQRAVFVIGAGRSGTSTVARAMPALGVELGNNFKRASAKNPTGFFEDAALLELSKAVRNRIGVRADSVRLIQPAELTGPNMADLRERARQIITRQFGTAPIWGFKYGRTLRILPFWEPVLQQLEIEPSFVIALRNPLSVARSRAKLDARRGQQAISDLEWLVSIVPFLRRTRGYPLTVVDYDELIDAPEAQLTRITRQLKLPLTDSVEAGIEEYAQRFIRKSMRHTRFTDAELAATPDLNALVLDAYRLLERLALDQWRIDEAPFWDAWQDVETGLERLRPILSMLDAQESSRRWAVINPFSPMAALGAIRNLLRR